MLLFWLWSWLSYIVVLVDVVVASYTVFFAVIVLVPVLVDAFLKTTPLLRFVFLFWEVFLCSCRTCTLPRGSQNRFSLANLLDPGLIVGSVCDWGMWSSDVYLDQDWNPECLQQAE